MNDIAAIIAAAAAELENAGIPDARREAASLFEYTLGRDRAFIIAHPEYVPNENEMQRFSTFVERRMNREPFHYITGTKEFYGLQFEVSPAVLIPRPETEMLVERGIEFLKARPEPRICEVGVGSGCITIALLKYLPSASAVGLELSDAAIEVARKNAVRHKVDGRFEIRRSDVFDGLIGGEQFDLIVSNPPYIPANDITGLQLEVRDHEPANALTDGGDGLSIIRRILEEAAGLLRSGGHVLIEIGAGQKEKVAEIAAAGPWASFRFENDLQGISRVLIARL